MLSFVLVLLGVSACFAGDVLLGGAGYGAGAGLGTGLGVGGGGFSAGASGYNQGSGAFDKGNAYKNVQGYSNQAGHRNSQGFSESSSNRYGSGFGQGSAGFNQGASGAQGSFRKAGIRQQWLRRLQRLSFYNVKRFQHQPTNPSEQTSLGQRRHC
ncbi:hypothetical protein MRX96_008847 [Rhipicephalus microplus]